MILPSHTVYLDCTEVILVSRTQVSDRGDRVAVLERRCEESLERQLHFVCWDYWVVGRVRVFFYTNMHYGIGILLLDDRAGIVCCHISSGLRVPGRHASEHFASGGFAFAIAKSEKCRGRWRGENVPPTRALSRGGGAGVVFSRRGKW